jgi:arabinofuranosyltransferase
MTGRGRTLGAVVLGLGPLVRPDLAVTAACLIVAWFLLARPRRVGGDVVAIFALPVVYQLFRMGYYAALVPTTALAKDAGGLHLAQGRHYAWDFVSAYALWLPLAVVVAIIGLRIVESKDRRFPIAAIAMVVGGLLHAGYIVAIGGDYMHARLLLPGFFAILLPASIVVRRRDTVVLGLIGVTAAWAIVSAVAFRPPPPPAMYGVASVADWRVVQGAKVVPKDDAFGFNGYESAAAYDRGVRGLVAITSQQPVPGADPTKLYVTMGSIGVPAWHAGEHVWIVDIGGLAEPIAARTTPVDGRPAGHRKQVDYAWYAARFGAGRGDAKVVAARHALSCGPLSGLLDAVTGDLTPRRFLSNIFHSVQYTRLHVPAGPAAAERKYC